MYHGFKNHIVTIVAILLVYYFDLKMTWNNIHIIEIHVSSTSFNMLIVIKKTIGI